MLPLPPLGWELGTLCELIATPPSPAVTRKGSELLLQRGERIACMYCSPYGAGIERTA